MQPHEPADLLDGLLGGSEACCETPCGRDPGLRVGFPAGLPDVVKDRSEHQGGTVGDALERLGRPRLTAHELRQLRRGVPAVAVQREAVVRVALRTTARRLPLGHQGRQHARVVELGDRGECSRTRPEDPQQCATLSRTEPPCVVLDGGGRRCAHPSGTATLEDRAGVRERLEQPDGEIGRREVMAVRHPQHPVDELERAHLLLRRPCTAAPATRQVGTDQRPGPTVRMIDRARIQGQASQELVRRQVVLSGIDMTQPPGDLLVQLEADGLVLGRLAGRCLRPAVTLGAYEVQRDPSSEQPLLGTAQPREVRRAEEAGRHERLEARVPDERGGGPAERLDVAQTTGAELEVRLEGLRGRPGPRVPLVVRLEQLLEEALRSPPDAAQDLAAHLRRETRVASEQSSVEQRGRRVELVGRSDRLTSGADRIADGQPDVPQRVDDGADELLERVALEPCVQHEQVDVRRGTELASAVATDGDERDCALRHLIERGVQSLQGRVDLRRPRLAPRRARTGPLECEPGGVGPQPSGRVGRVVVHPHAPSFRCAGRRRGGGRRGGRLRSPRRRSRRCGCARRDRPR